jgi:hypothetical protein
MRKSEAIMNCEICGIVDHHCVRGICPACREKFAPDALLRDLTHRCRNDVAGKHRVADALHRRPRLARAPARLHTSEPSKPRIANPLTER